MRIDASVSLRARGGAPRELRNPGVSERSICPRGTAAGGGRVAPLCKGSSDHENRIGGATAGFCCGSVAGLLGRGSGTGSGGATLASGGNASFSRGLVG